MTPSTKSEWRRAARRALATSLGLLLLAASLLKLWSYVRFPQAPRPSWTESRSVSDCIATGEATLGVVLLAGAVPRHAWVAAVSVFSLFVIITAAETTQGKASCGCFGAVQVRPIYTMFLDLGAVAALLVTGRPELERQNAEGRMQNGEAGRGRWLIAGAIGIAWVGIVLGMWLTRPVIAVAAAATDGQAFGKPGELVVLEPEKWPGHRFSLADHILPDHIDIGPQLTAGQWIVLLVHHDCDHCAAAVPKYIARYAAEHAGPHSSFIVPPSSFPQPPPRLAVIEMPPFANATDPPPWQLPPSVLSGRLDESRDWFATTPLALHVSDGIVLSAKGSDAAETPDPAWYRP